MAKHEKESILISQDAKIVLEELSELSGLPPERIFDEALLLYYKMTIGHYRILNDTEEKNKGGENEQEEHSKTFSSYGPSV
mgnify:CR=1 FL=1